MIGSARKGNKNSLNGCEGVYSERSAKQLSQASMYTPCSQNGLIAALHSDLCPTYLPPVWYLQFYTQARKHSPLAVMSPMFSPRAKLR